MVAVLVTLAAVAPASASPGQQPGAPRSVVLTPDHGPVGTTVSIEGDIDPSQVAGGSSAYYTLIGDAIVPDCEILVENRETRLSVTASGHATGSFIVGSRGRCFQQDRTVSVVPGRYLLTIGCHACIVGSFDVTPGSLARTGSPSRVLTWWGIGLVVVGVGLCSRGKCKSVTATRGR